MAKAPTKNLVTNALISRIIKASGNEHADTLEKSEIINNKDFFSTSIPAINIAMGGELTGGMSPGVLQIVGESKSFKTLFMLILAKAYMDKYPESVFVLFDSEFGASKAYFDSLGIDSNRVAHQPISTVEDLRGQVNKILAEVKRGEKIFFGVDSIGLLASNKEVNDAISGNEAADMTRAKALNSFFRTIVSQLPVLDVPMVIVNHSYDSIGGFIPTKTVKGGKGGYLAANDIWMITRAVDREKGGDKELLGYKFTIWIEKSRVVKEKSSIPVMVSFDGGVNKYSGIADLAEEGRFIEYTNKAKGLFSFAGGEAKNEAECHAFLDKLLVAPEFAKFVRDTYKQAGKQLIQVADNVVSEEE